jgi:hypothetical protein
MTKRLKHTCGNGCDNSQKTCIFLVSTNKCINVDGGYVEKCFFLLPRFEFHFLRFIAICDLLQLCLSAGGGGGG